ncbi:biotin carboxyl carrier protein [Paraburkholderia caledonica]|uniref:Biotin carboxyl carrier protein n=1 Tax=Paraburkholderia caledonica TaxID=134536 RepID=A0AB73IQ52_9BURK|nr:biotin carboxyl carrier protein [Paraburkholderia caledonica]
MLSTNEILEIISCLRQESIQSFELAEDDFSLRLKLRSKPIQDPDTPPRPSEPDLVTVSAPLPSVFYLDHPSMPRGTPSKGGSTVSEGSVIGYLKIGSVVLPVQSPCCGRIHECMAQDATLVGIGTKLFTVIAD